MPPPMCMEKKMSDTWKKEMVWATIVWRLAECNEKIPLNTTDTEYRYIEEDLSEMHSRDFLKTSTDRQFYVVGTKGRELLTKLVGMFDQATRFEIFNSVLLDAEMPTDILDEEGSVLDHCHDTRFNVQSTGTEDLRIAMMEFSVEFAKREKNKDIDFDPRKIVFLQLMAEGEIAKGTQPFWFDLKLGNVFDKIQTLSDNAYRWKDLGSDEEESWNLAQQVYTAGMLEQRKLDGAHCSLCGIPLAIFEAHAKADNEELLDCPNPECDGDFRDPTQMGLSGDVEYECPACGGDIRTGQTTCYRCGAHVDFSLPEGSVVEETIEETTTTTETYYEDSFYGSPGCYYGYTPYGYYDPWYPAADAFAVGLLCGALIW